MDSQKELDENLTATNRLLLDMVQNQKGANNNLAKIIITVSVCFCAIIISMVIGFFWYESNFNIIEGEAESEISQEASNSGSGDIIMNDGGDLNYGTSETDN